MAQLDPTQSLFGPTPLQVQQSQQLQQDQFAQQYAAMDPYQRVNYGWAKTGAGLGNLGANLFGMSNPQVDQAQQTQQALAGVDTNDPSALLQAAVAMRAIDPARAAAMVKMAQDRQKEIADLELTKAHAKYYETPKTGGNVPAQLANKLEIVRRSARVEGMGRDLKGDALETFVQQQVDAAETLWRRSMGITDPNTPAGYTGSNGVVGTPVSPNTAVNFTQPMSKASLDAAIADAQARGDTQAVTALQAITPRVDLPSKSEQIATDTAARIKAKNENTPQPAPLTNEGQAVLSDMVTNSRLPVGWGRMGIAERNDFLNREGAARYGDKGTGQSLAADQLDAKARAAALTKNQMVVTTIKPFVDMVDTNGEILKGLARKAVATNSSLANKSVNWLLQNAGDNPDTAELLAQMKIFKDEAARVVSNPNLTGVLSDTARQEMQAVIDGSMPINSMERVINRLQQDSHIRVNKLMDENQRLKDSFNPKKKGSSPSVSDSTAPVNASPTAPIIRKYNPATGKIE